MLSIMGQFVEHNRFNFWAMPKSIIGKKKSIICLALLQCSLVVVDRKHAKSCTANELNYVLQTTATHLEK